MAQRFRTDVAFGFIALLCVLCVVSGCRNAEDLPPWENISQSAGDSYTPAVAVDDRGNVYVVWSDSSAVDTVDIYFAEKPANGSWSQPLNISENTSISAAPFIDVDNLGNVHVCWWDVEYDAPDERIRYRMRNANGNWQESELLAQTTTSDSGYTLPRIICDVNDNVFVVWEGGSAGVSNLRYVVKSPSSPWSEIMVIPLQGMGASNPAELATDLQGNLHLTYEGGDNNIQYLMRSSNGDWQNWVTITHENSPLRPDITVDGSGIVYITWCARDPDSDWREYVFYAHNGTGNWSEPIRLPKLKERDIAVLNSAAATEDGILHIVWQTWTEDSSGNYGHADIYYAKKYPDDTWSEIHNISNTEGRSICEVPSITVDELGNAHIVWADDESGNFEVLYLKIPKDSL